ncbi:hypothetical protein [Sagittula sp. SSi028]
MKAVLLGILAAAVIGTGAWFGLNALNLSTAQTHADDRSVRID